MASQGSLSRGLAIIASLAKAHDGLSLARVAETVDLPKSAAHRLLHNLIADGYVRQAAETRRYSLTFTLPMLGLQFLSTTSITNLAMPMLEELADGTGHLVRLALADDERLFWVAKRQGARSGLRYEPDVDHAAEVPLASSATGIAWLSRLTDDEAVSLAARQDVPQRHPVGPNMPVGVNQLVSALADARARGWASVHDSFELGISAVAMAIVDHASSRPIGAVSVAGPTVHITPERVEAIVPTLSQAVHDLEMILPTILPVTEFSATHAEVQA